MPVWAKHWVTVWRCGELFNAKKIVFDREYAFQTAFCQQFADKYLKRFQEVDYFENVFHLTVLIKTDFLEAGIKEAAEQIQDSDALT